MTCGGVHFGTLCSLFRSTANSFGGTSRLDSRDEAMDVLL